MTRGSRKPKRNRSDTSETMGSPGVSEDQSAEVLAELRQLRQEHTEAAGETKTTLTRLENNIKDLVEKTAGLEQKTTQLEERVSESEDKAARLERAIAFLLFKEAKLSAKCEDLESRSRRKNIRIFGIPEGAEKNDTVRFVTDFIRSTLKLPETLEVRIERAHRLMSASGARGGAAPPRAIIVRFLDYFVKEKVLRQAWEQRSVLFQANKIFFNQDYTNEVQMKRMQVREVIKRLKEKNIKAQSPYPAQLKLFLQTGIKTFTTLTEAVPVLKEMGIEVKVREADNLWSQWISDSWTTAGRKKKRASPEMTREDLQAFINTVTCE